MRATIFLAVLCVTLLLTNVISAIALTYEFHVNTELREIAVESQTISRHCISTIQRLGQPPSEL